MIYDWYLIFNFIEFNSLGLTSKTYSFFLEGNGYEDILVTKGNEVSALFRDTLLPVNFMNSNPFKFNNYAVYIDANQDVFVGILVE